MTSPDYKTLFKLQPLFESGSKYLCQQAGIINIFTTQDNFVELTPRVEIHFRLKGVDRWGTVIPPMRLVPDAFNAQLIFTVQSDRENNAATHSVYVSTIMDTFKNYSVFNEGVLTGSVLKYHRCHDLIFEGVATRTDDLQTGVVDTSVVTYLLKTNIEPTAWPSGSINN